MTQLTTATRANAATTVQAEPGSNPLAPDWTATPFARRVARGFPEAFAAFAALERTVFAPRALDTKTKELIAVAVTLTTQCESCIGLHTRKARLAGATEDEITEALFVAMELRAGAAFGHFRAATAAIDDYARDVDTLAKAAADAS